jgi:hypothetical protein
LGLELAFPGHPWILDIKHQTPWAMGEKKVHVENVLSIQKNEKNSMLLFPYLFLLRFWTFLCMGSKKTPKTKLSKKTPKVSGLKKKRPPTSVGVFFFFQHPLAWRQAGQPVSQAAPFYFLNP